MSHLLGRDIIKQSLIAAFIIYLKEILKCNNFFIIMQLSQKFTFALNFGNYHRLTRAVINEIPISNAVVQKNPIPKVKVYKPGYYVIL